MRSILLHSGLAALAAFLPNWHWTKRALEPSSPAPKSSESREGGRRRVRWLAFRSSCSPILVPGLAARGSSTPWACALRGERRLWEGVVCGQDGGDCSRCGPIRGRGVAAKGTAEGPTGENRTQGEECPVRAVAEVTNVWIRHSDERAGGCWEKATAEVTHARCWSMRTASVPAQCGVARTVSPSLVLSRMRSDG